MPHPRHSPCCSQIIIFQVGAKLVTGQKFGNFHTGRDIWKFLHGNLKVRKQAIFLNLSYILTGQPAKYIEKSFFSLSILFVFLFICLFSKHLRCLF